MIGKGSGSGQAGKVYQNHRVMLLKNLFVSLWANPVRIVDKFSMGRHRQGYEHSTHR
jgi:hypothetical protein